MDQETSVDSWSSRTLLSHWFQIVIGFDNPDGRLDNTIGGLAAIATREMDGRNLCGRETVVRGDVALPMRMKNLFGSTN
jgi:hypothetical protein